MRLAGCKPGDAKYKEENMVHYQVRFGKVVGRRALCGVTTDSVTRDYAAISCPDCKARIVIGS